MAANQSVSMAKEETEKLSLISDTDLDTHKKISLLSLETENATTENKHGNTRAEELVTDVSRRTESHVMEMDYENRCTGGSKSKHCRCRTCEVEVSFGGEADLHKHFNSCKKNPGHQNFVPVDQFSMEDLPSDYRNDNLFNLIRAMSDLTVRVSVNYVSDRRPKTWPHSDDPYPFCEESCSTGMRTGTGWVWNVEKVSKWCYCSTCEDSSSAKIKYALIYIRTAAHVVYDELEGQHTTCHLFFDKGGTPDLCPGVARLTPIPYIETSTEQDLCELKYMTYDLSLADRLKKSLVAYRLLDMKACLWYRENIRERPPPSNSVPDSGKVLTVIVSHPHGCSKHVTVGFCTSRVMDINKIYSQLTYTTATCRGSSGAHIFLLGNVLEEHDHVHSGNCKGNSNLNHSSKGLDAQHFPDTFLQTGSLIRALLFCQEYAETVEFEGQLHRHYDICENSSNQNFLPVDELNDSCMIPHNRWFETLELFRAKSKLIVRVSVKCVSGRRPESWPGGEQLDFCCDDSSRNMMVKGTGVVSKVARNSRDSKTCSCKECQVSRKPKTEFASIYISTSAQVVYDEFEGEHSTCYFFFDKGRTPDTCPGVVKLHGASNVDCTEEGSREVMYVTHNMYLVDRLTNMIDKCNNSYMFLSSKKVPLTLCPLSNLLSLRKTSCDLVLS